MKRIIISILLLGLTSTVHAHVKPTVVNNTTVNIDESAKNEAGVALDAPYLIKLADDWFVGAEGSKDLYSTSFNDGWGVYGKVTFTGTLFDFKKGDK